MKFLLFIGLFLSVQAEAVTYSAGSQIDLPGGCTTLACDSGRPLLTNHIEYLLTNETPITRRVSPGSVGSFMDGFQLKALADLNGDGFSDYIFQHRSGFIVYWLLGLNGTAIGGAMVPGSTGITADYALVEAQDITRDGIPDLIFQHAPTGSIIYWEIKRLPEIQVVSGGLVSGSQSLGSHYRLAGMADMNRDGHVDIVLQGALGNIVYWYLNGPVPVSGVQAFAGAQGFTYRLVSVRDVNRDGNPDMILQNFLGGHVVYWHMNNAQFISGTMIDSPYVQFLPTQKDNVLYYVRSRLVGAMDINQDGSVDLIFQF